MSVDIMYGYNQNLIRATNQLLILEALRKKSQARVDLAKQLHLSNPAVSKNVNEFIKKGLVRVVGEPATRIGRRPVLLELNSHYGCVCSLELGERETRMALANLKGELFEVTAFAAYETLDSLAVKDIAEHMERFLSDAPRTRGALQGIVIAHEQIPAGGYKEGTPAREGMESILKELKRLLCEIFRCPVRVENSMCMAAIGTCGTSNGSEGILCLRVEQTVSCGVVCAQQGKGQMWPESVVLSGDLGEIIPDASSAIAEWRSGRISQRNTLAEQATSLSILRTLQEKFVAGEGYLGEQFDSPEVFTLEDIRLGVEKGDGDCVYAVQNAAVRLATATVNFLRLMKCRTIILEGTVKIFGSLYLDTFTRFLHETVADGASAEVKWSVLGRDSVLQGGAYCAADDALVSMTC